MIVVKLIVRADDLGMCEGVNLGIYKAVKSGMITSVGLMSNMPNAQQGYEMIQEFSNIALGQHTNICLGKPLSNPKKIPSLVNQNGYFCSSKEIRNRKEDTIDIKECKMEIEAQLMKFKEITGKYPDYFEGHAVFSKNFFQALKNVAERYQLFYCNPVEKNWVQKYGIEVVEFYHLDENNEYDIEKYILDDEAKILEKECSVVAFHPGFIDDFLLNHSSFTNIRARELAFICSSKFQQYINKKQIQLVNFCNYR